MRRVWHRFKETFLSLKGSPHEIAKSFAVGMVAAFCPFFGLHTLVSAALAWVFRLSFPAVYLASWISNPLTIAFFLAFEYETGRVILGWERVSIPHESLSLAVVRTTGWNLLGPLLVGWLTLSVVFGLLTYPAARYALKKAEHGDAASPGTGV